MPKISIIIPVYNASKYLAECLESVLTQTYEDLEVICINDGSTDDSLKILEDFQKKDSRIKIINQKNQGVSAARNAGLEIAVGRYIGFVDGDDTVEKDFFQKNYHIAEMEKSDSVFSKSSNIEDFTLFNKIYSGEKISRQILPIFFKNDQLNAVWSKIFRREIIQESNIRFPVGISHGEDAHFNIQFLTKSQKVVFADFCGYNYREAEGSATRNILEHNYLQKIIETYDHDWKPIIGNLISDNEMEKLKRNRLINSVISLVYIYGNRGNSFTDVQRFSKLKSIVKNDTVQKVFSDQEIFKEMNLGKYSVAIFRNILRQNVFLLYLLTQYSYYRNK